MAANVDPKTILMWVQVGGQMAQLVTTSIEKVGAILDAAGASEAEQKATLAKTHALYDAAIAHEEQIAKG
jgi:hypothetical protein